MSLWLFQHILVLSVSGNNSTVWIRLEASIRWIDEVPNTLRVIRHERYEFRIWCADTHLGYDRFTFVSLQRNAIHQKDTLQMPRFQSPRLHTLNRPAQIGVAPRGPARREVRGHTNPEIFILQKSQNGHSSMGQCEAMIIRWTFLDKLQKHIPKLLSYWKQPVSYKIHWKAYQDSGYSKQWSQFKGPCQYEPGEFPYIGVDAEVWFCSLKQHTSLLPNSHCLLTGTLEIKFGLTTHK